MQKTNNKLQKPGKREGERGIVHEGRRDDVQLKCLDGVINSKRLFNL